jgi:hypothetical protein
VVRANKTLFAASSCSLYPDTVVPASLVFDPKLTLCSKIESFIRSKYESRRWAMEGAPPSDPSTLEGGAGQAVSTIRHHY